MSPHEQHLRSMYSAIADKAPSDQLARFFHREAEQIEYPSLMRPQGHRRPLADIVAGADRGQQIIETQSYDVHNVIEQNDQVAVQLTWTAVLARDIAGLPAGGRLVAHVAAFYVFRDGLVLRQSSYDCYDPVGALTSDPGPEGTQP